MKPSKDCNKSKIMPFPTFGRVYAAYGGVFIVLSILWGWGIDGKKPDVLDWVGAGICLIGVMVILLPRS